MAKEDRSSFLDPCREGFMAARCSGPVLSRGQERRLCVRWRRCRDQLPGVDVQRSGDPCEPGQRGRGAASHHIPEMRSAHASMIGQVCDRDLSLLGDLSDSVHDPLVKLVHARARYGQSVVAESAIPD